MKSIKICRNEATIIGTVTEEPVLHHECKDVQVYKFKVAIPRISGNVDEIPVHISSVVLEKIDIKIRKGEKYRITGEYRSFNSSSEEKNRLLLFVFARDVELYELLDDESKIKDNRLEVEGYVAKMIPVRETPGGRRIMEIMLAVNRKGYKSSYIPCLIWYPNDYLQNNIKVGSELFVVGRIQSREYFKRYDNDNVETKVAYEVSTQLVRIKYKKEYEEEAVN